MQLFHEKIFCCGCEACKEICPHKAIEMLQDEEGFFYPVIDDNKCVKCGVCIKTCPMKYEPEEVAHGQIVFGVKNKRYDVRMKESSGGFFSVLCNYALSKNGVIYGVRYGRDYKSVEYDRVEKNYEELFGSKYVQSVKGGVYNRIKEDLCEGRFVLFAGTPCDIAGLKKFLNMSKCKTEHMILCDMLCHGVPSPQLYSEYITFLEDVFCSKAKSFSFRDKSVNGWERCCIKAEFHNGLQYQVPSMRDFYSALFSYALVLRPSCYKCVWKKDQRNADFTLGDFWGIDKIDPLFADRLGGVSLILLNTEKAKRILKELQAEIECQQYSIEQAMQYNDSLVRSRPECIPDRDKKFQELLNKGIRETIRDTYQLWKMVEWVFEKFRDIKTVVDISVNQNWVLLGIKKKWKEVETLGIYVNRSNESCSVVKDYEKHNTTWNAKLIESMNVDLLRIDLEGLEYSFFQELQFKIETDMPIIMIELMRKWQNNGHVPNDILMSLQQYNYTCYALDNKCRNIQITHIASITEKTEAKWFFFFPPNYHVPGDEV